MGNTLSRALAERDPGQVVLGKVVLGNSAAAILAVLEGENYAFMGECTCASGRGALEFIEHVPGRLICLSKRDS